MNQVVASCIVLLIIPICSFSASLRLTPQEIVGSSDLIVIGTITNITLPDDPNMRTNNRGDASIRVERVLFGKTINDVQINSLAWMFDKHPKRLQNGQRANAVQNTCLLQPQPQA